MGPFHDPELARELAEDHQRELLDEAETERLIDHNPGNDEHEKPVTDDKDDFIPSPDQNTHIRRD